MSYIDVDKFYEDMEKKFHIPPLVGTCSSDNVLLKHLLEDAPTADVVEVKHGKNVTQANYVDEFICSECGIVIQDLSRYDPDENYYFEYECKYCPECGAKMDKEGE